MERRNAEDLWPLFTGRPPGQLYPDAPNLVAGKNVMITGGGGFLGSALAEQIARSGANRLLLLDQSEAGLAKLQVRLNADNGRNVYTALGDVRDKTLVLELLRSAQIDTVFHAAACKHVPLLEHNPFTASSVNALGTSDLIDACEQSKVQQFVLLSTDKAVDPVSVLGVTKRIAEQVCLDTGKRGDLDVKIMRLGNVLGSTGSIAPLLLDQIAHGEVLTLTHPEASRYFFSPSEAVQYLLHVLSLRGAPWLWVPLSGPQRRVSELAAFLQQQFSGPHPAESVRFTGLRHGEKLRECPWSSRERAEPIDEHLFAVSSVLLGTDELLTGMRLLKNATRHLDLDGWLRACNMLVPEYQPSEVLLNRKTCPIQGLPA